MSNNSDGLSGFDEGPSEHELVHIQAFEPSAAAAAVAMARRQQSLWQQRGLPCRNRLAVGNPAWTFRLPVHIDASPSFLVSSLHFSILERSCRGNHATLNMP